MKRLIECDFPKQLISWMADYLRNRSQAVRLGVTKSDEVHVLSGVPQGSILGPYLYSFRQPPMPL